jgi:hypothetical protein
VAWKESGGFAGTYSPNAAFVQTVVQLAAGTTYTIKLVWKSNTADPGTIWAGAGPINTAYSPTRLTAIVHPTAANLISSIVSTKQYTLTNNDGTTWSNVDYTIFGIAVPVANKVAVISGNADLWTSSTGYNQDIGIGINGDSYPTEHIDWKESGGYAGTYSPNAAFVETVLSMAGGTTTHEIILVWKANKPDPGSIWAGAGPIGGQYSPTRLTVFFPPAE